MDFCPYCQRFPGDDYVNDDLSKGTKDHLNYCFACGRIITNNPIIHVLNLCDDYKPILLDTTFSKKDYQ